MKLILAAILILAQSALGTAAIQAAENSAAVSADAPAAKPKPKKICKSNARSTGTRINRPVCKTQAEWDDKEDGQDIGLRSKTSRGDMENVGGMNQP